MDVGRALALLKEKGYKYTDKREEMLNIFEQEKRYLTAKEMLEFMQQKFPDISFDTIYRNLALFEELSILESTELQGENRYRICCSPDHHHHHLICLGCGSTRHIRFCPMDAMLGEPSDFMITDHKFEIYGYCTDCG